VNMERDEAFFDREGFLERLGGSEEMVQIFLEDFLKEMIPWMEELHAAMTERSWEEIRQGAHKIKGSAANMGALGIQRIARAMESAGARGDSEELQRLMPSLVNELERLRMYIEITLLER